MYDTMPMTSSCPPPTWRELVWPREHGSWSLALEPLALALLVAPSWGGAALALAAVAGFFSRRPLRTAVTETRPERRVAARRALDGCGVVALAGFGIAVAANGLAWSAWLLPSIAAGGIFVFFDLQKAGREGLAEVAGAAAFGWLPAAFAISAGWPAAAAAALGAVMASRSVPTVLTVRAALRARKAAPSSPALAVLAALVAVVGVGLLARAGLAPSAALVLAIVLAARSMAWLGIPRLALRASTMGLIEAALGVGFVVTLAVTWRN